MSAGGREGKARIGRIYLPGSGVGQESRSLLQARAWKVRNLAAIRIVTDSTASLPRHMAEEYNISVVPLRVQFGQQSFRDGVDLCPTDFYQMLDGPVMPVTSQPPPSDFIDIYQSLSSNGDSVISVHISSTLSGTFQVAELSKASLPGRDIGVVDSRTTSLGLGLLVLEAAKAAQRGIAKQEILTMLRRLIHLAKEAMTFTREKALPRGLKIAVAHVNAQGEAQSLAQIISAEFGYPLDSILIADGGATLASHVGPGALAIVAAYE